MTIITHATFASLNTSVRMIGNLYSLNDLHHAAGGRDKHSPRHWSRLQQTKELIKEIEKEQICAIQSKQGLGTFVCKELVCDYAAWINASFHLKIIRNFLTTNAGESDHISTKSDRVPLKDAVNMLVAKTANINYSDAYRLVHQKMGVMSVEELTVKQVPQAVEYVHGLVVQATALQGELLPKKVPEWETPEYKAQHRRGAIALMTIGLEMERKQSDILRKMEDMLIDVRDALNDARSCSGAIFDGLHESQFHLCFETEIMKSGHKLGRERGSLRDK